MQNLFGMPFAVNRLLCERPKFVRWRRTHRNNRIAKKWRKSGCITTICKGVACRAGRSLVMCPCVEVAMRKQIGATGGATESQIRNNTLGL